MTGTEIIDFFQTLVEDSIDTDAALILLNNAKSKVEGEREWEMLKKIDSSKSASTSAITLPTDFDRPIDGTIYVGTQPYIQVPFEQRQINSQSALRWYLDMANDSFYLLGTNLSGTVYFPYIYQTADVAAGSSPVWPARFHPLLAFEMAEIFYAIDQGDRGKSWDDRWSLQKELLRRSMVSWDVALQKRAIENVTPVDGDNEISLGDM